MDETKRKGILAGLLEKIDVLQEHYFTEKEKGTISLLIKDTKSAGNVEKDEKWNAISEILLADKQELGKMLDKAQIIREQFEDLKAKGKIDPKKFKGLIDESFYTGTKIEATIGKAIAEIEQFIRTVTLKSLTEIYDEDNSITIRNDITALRFAIEKVL